ncbi:MAG: LacI family DNA-binding transcriptional regulator [Tabrizicola sp.]|uniref:LacI family DNA-binding transcriptional regulator n=1 Tax=Tabrizicola sp. TaxID=2005166 RepID=UPI002733B7D4|nr:LacI family DNA-binding transcriptional regulator [Tabrizicola sp.]MDP3261337.1 LacI family DNA-binding transcriptional regulator [Tabrizicola sp.]MDP3647335.1 LacI family DNA-binding transcriptional regulator [Paracoccaceae bacterium]MDZ4067634.1 LacI family DNA-binding transcriptional regulator [Tabrizicola sp.]
MRRPTIPDLAKASGVSVATINRVLSSAPNVRLATRERVQRAAEEIGFYGLGSIQARVAAARPRLRFGVLLLQPHRPFYKIVASELEQAAASAAGADVDLRLEFLEDLSPHNVAFRALELARDCSAICLTSAVHPVVTEALEQIQAKGIPVFALISQISVTGQMSYIGLDNWKVGRTSAWAFANICKTPGKIGILMGNPRYRNQEMNEAGFRSYFREYAPDFTLLEPISTFESAAVAEEMTERLLADHHDLAGLYISGGGIRGALAALRAGGKAGSMVVVGYDLTDVTRDALLDGTMTMVISHPLARLARDAIDGMIRACANPFSNQTSIVPFEIYTRENL